MGKIDNNPLNLFIKKTSCPICGEVNKIVTEYAINYYSSRLLELNLIKDPPEIFLLCCKNCTHRFPSSVLKPEIFEHYYSEINAEVYLNKSAEPIDGLKSKHIKIAEDINKLFPHGGKILDIGCGYGFLLSYLDKNIWKCYGIEPSDLAATVAKSKGINVFSKFVNTCDSINERFDVIIMLDVIEHLLDPNEMIQKAIGLLSKEGTLIIGTGDISSFNAKIGQANWTYFCSYEHISFFTKESLIRLLSNFNFANLNIKYIPYRPGFIFNLYTILKNITKIFLFRFLRLKNNFSIHLAFDHIIVFAKFSY